MSESDQDFHTERSVGVWLPEIPVAALSQRYEIEGEPLGRGGFGLVYRAKKLRLPQWVAVKRLITIDGKPPDLAEQRRFVREVTLAASLRHRHIVRIEDWGRDGDGVYVVMELVGGGTLKQQVDRQGALPLPQLLRCARQICLGLQAAHEQGILHRDLKPANMLLDETDNVLLADFGLARAAEGGRDAFVKSSGVPMFTFAYASPEQMAGDVLDCRSDLFSLGATLLHLATGVAPIDRHFDVDEAPVAVQPLLTSLLKKKRDLRPDDVAAVLRDLNSLLAATPATASPQTVDKPARRPAVGGRSDGDDLAGLVQQLLAKVAQQHVLARELQAEQHYAEAVAALEEIPDEQRHLLDAGLYEACVRQRDQVQSLDREISTAVKALRFDGVQEKIVALQQLQPWREDLGRLLKSLPAAAAAPAKPQPPKSLTAPFDANTAKAAQVSLAKFRNHPAEWTNSVGMKFRPIPAGTYKQMTLTQPFWLGVYQVTQGQWQQVMGTTPWKGQSNVIEGSDVAATYVSWEDVVAFCEQLSKKEGKRYRLPTEAEWEWSCRAGTTTAYSFGDDESQLGQYAWFRGNAWDKNEMYAHRVGQKRANPFGLYDVHGNVWEWCADWYGSDDPMESNSRDPQGPSSGSSRVLRGGSWDDEPIYLRSSRRYDNTPAYRDGNIGCRVLLERP